MGKLGVCRQRLHIGEEWPHREIGSENLVISAVGRGFQIVGSIAGVEVIARGPGLRELERLNSRHGEGRWRKMKGAALVRIPAGDVVYAEVHWYEAHGIGMKEIKIKRLLG